MTTIAYNHRDKELASDSQGTNGWIIMPKVYTKIHKLSFGWVGFCGNAADMRAAIKYDIYSGGKIVVKKRGDKK